MFESGVCNLSLSSLKEVFTMSCGNYIYVAGSLLGDSFEFPGGTEIRQLAGNIGGGPGISLLTALPALRTLTPLMNN
jgi:hypothetical protein